ncbi:MAG: hypothetical protein KJZ92_14690 [Rhodocyclaceae bacterium]|jgi:hypothetical protein|nr:hypothetical protein [Rhodocyclaceae bacterium]
MNVLLGHIDFAPLMYGLVMFLGLMVMWWKLTHGRWLGLMIDIGVFALVFKLHGGTMQGGFAAMVAALLAGLVFPMMLRR